MKRLVALIVASVLIAGCAAGQHAVRIGGPSLLVEAVATVTPEASSPVETPPTDRTARLGRHVG